jgi:chitinase
MKEHAAIVIMASSASVSATSTLVIAAQKLYYGGYPNQGGAVFITMATQRTYSPVFAYSIPILLQKQYEY